MTMYMHIIAPEWALSKINPVFNPTDDDPEARIEATFGLVSALHPDQRGILVKEMDRVNVPSFVFRVAMSEAWMHDHRHVIAAAGKRSTLARWFKRAQFELELPEQITVWRGTSALSKAEAERGFSWTTDRDTACFFAMRFAERNGNPLLLKATVHRRDVAWASDMRSEREVVLISPVRGAEQDGTPEDWREGMTRNVARREQS